MREVHRIAIAGFGNVGQALAHMVAAGHPAASGIVIVGVSDPRYGTVASTEGLDAAWLLASAGDSDFGQHGAHMPEAGVLEMIEATDADTLVELTITDLETGEPAATHLRHAMSVGWNVSTTNKGPIALYYGELLELAHRNRVSLAFEGTVMSGTPVVSLARHIRSARCQALFGILNGTTNYILSQVELGVSHEEALARAQAHGFAEADPSADVDGHDAAAKLVILAEIAAGADLPIASVERVPLSSVSTDEVLAAIGDGERVRYLASLDQRQDQWHASVSPRRLPDSDPLARVVDAGNGVTFRTELLGDVTLFGPGAGPSETAFAVLSDLEGIQRASV